MTMSDTSLSIRNYAPHHQQYFESLNREWIEQFFVMEPVDILVLKDPQTHIINKGGEILMAHYDEEVAGTVALKPVKPGVFEFTKMAVDHRFRGKKVGYALAMAAIEKAKEKKATSIILYSNTKLAAAIALYRKIGFHEVPLDGPYKRSDIKMELVLKG
jgi:ribosomal protein S18 acetylase RimI-like enzyme